MNAITVNTAISNFPKLITNTIRNYEETLIVSDEGSVILIAEEEWNSMTETIRLFRDKKSLSALLEGHALRKQKKKTAIKTIEEAFYDLQNIDTK
jgi:PHD/YefM family antitoxin component YafN of YafNO toxin-antitoxin module